ncbi:MAG: S1 RNA-binding domain-containing protein, partial [Clostridia bacterium]
MQFETGTVVKGKITRITNFGAFVAIDGGGVGMIHISEVSNGFVKEIKEFLSEGQEVEALVISCDENGKTGLSMRRIKPKYP